MCCLARREVIPLGSVRRVLMARGWAGLSEEFVGGRALSGVCPQPGAGLGSVRNLFPARSRAQPCRASGAASSLWPLCISHKQRLQAPGARGAVPRPGAAPPCPVQGAGAGGATGRPSPQTRRRVRVRRGLVVQAAGG